MLARVAEVEIKFTVGAKHESVHSVVVLLAFDSFKNYFFLISFVVAVFVGKQIHVRALRHQYFVAHHKNSKRRVEFSTLIKHLVYVSFAVAVGIFQNHDAVAFAFSWTARNGGAVVVGFEHPHAPTVVNVNVSRIGNGGF